MLFRNVDGLVSLHTFILICDMKDLFCNGGVQRGSLVFVVRRFTYS
jgi:hypothetical protein